METYNLNLKQLNKKELIEIEGGLIDPVTAISFAMAVGSFIYGAGYACGQAYYYYTHP